MPYIDRRDRERLDAQLAPLLRPGDGPRSAGELNYVITMIACSVAARGYGDLNEVLGVFDAAGKEFYRRVVAPYEDEKARLNGEVYPERLLPRRPRTLDDMHDGTGRRSGW